ncbi:MAG: hypothetical protein AB7F19_07195 [Candidatus Babeliales bacterium]
MHYRLITLILLSAGSLLPASLKVYNRSDRAMSGFTNPQAFCRPGKDTCALFPYESLFHSHAVTFKLPGEKIQEFYWREIIGPHYYITVDLQKDEHATLKLYGQGAYKFKSTRMQYAQIVK